MVSNRQVLSVAAIVCVILPSIALAQESGIAGTVRDSSGGILPGVTVEVSSPVLIEKVRTVFSDADGRYSVVDLRPGPYAVSFTLPGFSILRREGVMLSAGFTATVNAEMQVGALEETVTVSGQSPLVDTQNTRQTRVVSTEMMEALPSSSRAVSMLIALTPGLTGTASVGGSQGAHAGQSIGSFRGKTGSSKIHFDGMRINNFEGSGNNGYMINSAAMEEMTLETGGVSAESPAGGAAVNAIPKSGGNTFKFGSSWLYTNDRFQSENLDDELRARGLTSVNKVLKLYDVDVTAGGPIRRDKLWFFGAYRAIGNRNQNAGIFWNKTQGTPFYTPDLDRPADAFEYNRSHLGRLTWQASQKNQVNFFLDVQDKCVCRRAIFQAPESIPGWKFWPQGMFAVTWSAPLTSRLLLQAGGGAVISHWPNYRQPGVDRDDISILEQSTGLRYNSEIFTATRGSAYGDIKVSDRFFQRFAASYITGSHAFKAGFQVDQGIHHHTKEVNGGVSYTFLNARPVSLTQYATPFEQKEIMKADLGMFVQDQWAVRRLTLNYGLRFDYFNAFVPAQRVAAGAFVPERNFGAVHGVPLWKDVSPRFGAAYDLLGNGRTALKVSLGRYLGTTAVDIAQANNPMVTSVVSVNRSWADADSDFVPDCDLTNPAQNGECGAYADQNFGKLNPRATSYADDVLRGFGVRDYSWDFAAEAQHELRGGISVNGGYYRSWYGNFSVTDNLAVTSADFGQFCVKAPADPRLPGGGGYDVCGMADVSAAKFGLVTNQVTQASNFGKQSRVNNFFSVGMSARFGSARVGGGVDTGRTTADRCFVVDSPEERLNCRVVTPFAAQTQVKVNGSYTLPRDFAVSAVFQNVSGPEILAIYNATSAEIAPSLGRALSGGRRTATVPLIAPGTEFDERMTQVDVRLSKIFRVGTKAQFQANFDLYNALNANSVLAVNGAYGAQWLQPQRILDGRLIQLGGRFSF